MLKKISIHNYKCFIDAELNLSSLNLLAGANSSGKSSVIQALRLCIDNMEKPIGKETSMSSRDRKTGRFNELRSFLTTNRTFSIGLVTEKGNVTTHYTLGDDSMLTTSVTLQSNPSELAKEIAEQPVFYLPAHRNSANDIFPMNMEYINSIGVNGEYVIDYYAHHRSNLLNDTIVYDKSLKTLEGQVNYWLKLLTGYTINVDAQGETYSVRYKNPSGFEIRPYHIGTGISFITALIITCLSAPQNGLVIIENPELHLHPKAQAQAIDFFSVIAQSGIQIIIETHSDHLFNGIRRLVAQKKMSKESVSIYFFKTNEIHESRAVEVALTDKGRIIKYEAGLFNQFDDDLDAILQAK